MKKNDLIIFEGAMCCSTGICGPEPDTELIALSETLKRLQKEYGDQLQIMRASLTFNTLIFMSHPEIARLVKEKGPEVLPITTINGEIIAKQHYLLYEEIKEHLGKRIEET